MNNSYDEHTIGYKIDEVWFSFFEKMEESERKQEETEECKQKDVGFPVV